MLDGSVYSPIATARRRLTDHLHLLGVVLTPEVEHRVDRADERAVMDPSRSKVDPV
ncbi:hypothetical protein [Pseudofrankia asymbiotica]|uniref:hypothetical protein n=1 Tax=Pseudofrankia asymbiotica TaxID=1834516 RepID=UPI001304375C|nr:hypothetical protein [Pseudofrankia asymbiotica]